MLSVIVPVYNSEAYLAECLDSLIRQTYRDMEIIVIDDGSTDASGEIAKSYLNRRERFYYIQRDNHGVSYTRNEGIRMAAGQYVMFIDCDDYIEDNACELLMDKIISTNADMVVCDYREFSPTEEKHWQIPPFDTGSVYDHPSLLFDINSGPENKIFKKSVITDHDITFPVNTGYEDAAFVLTFMKYAEKIAQVSRELTHYRNHDQNTSKKMDESVLDIFKVLDLINEQWLPVAKNDPDLMAYLEYFNINRLTVYNLRQISQPDEDFAMRFISKSFAYLDTNFPDWRHNEPFKKHDSLLKRMIKTSQSRTVKYVKKTRKQGGA